VDVDKGDIAGGETTTTGTPHFSSYFSGSHDNPRNRFGCCKFLMEVVIEILNPPFVSLSNVKFESRKDPFDRTFAYNVIVHHVCDMRVSGAGTLIGDTDLCSQHVPRVRLHD
jgi:hypothetical protein